MTPKPWHIRDRTFAWGTRTYLMGILNVTPDSFSDGGLHDSLEAAIAHANKMAPYVDLLDIGGESTRPGAAAVSIEDELARVIPAIEAIRVLHPDLPISIDTTKAVVADAALKAGADLVNDVAAGRFDLEMLPIVAKHKVPYILMHMQGSPRTMQSNPTYGDVAQEVKQFLCDGVMIAHAAGVNQVAIDPGIGFGKTLDHNLALLRELNCLQDLNAPVLVGVSRKSFIGKLCSQNNPKQRVFGTAAACAVAIANGADILRVHDPREIRDICRVTDAIYRPDYIALELETGLDIETVPEHDRNRSTANTVQTQLNSQDLKDSNDSNGKGKAKTKSGKKGKQAKSKAVKNAEQ
jgi:dihydropteroate synthase